MAEREERAARTPAVPVDEVRNTLRRRQVIGIVLIAAAILVLALLRADGRAIFPPGWWRW